MTITFRPNPPIDALRIIELVQKNRHIKLAGNEKLRIERALPEARDRAQAVRDVLRALGVPKLREAAFDGSVIPAQAGIQRLLFGARQRHWVPACAGSSTRAKPA